jgi:phage repressor protein C with HTH and peptisase S24 domain
MKEKNINQTNLSEITGISTKTIQRYIKGESSPDLKNLEKIAKALEIPIEKLLGIKTLKVEFIEQNNKIEIPYYPETFAAAGAGAYNYEEAPKSITFTKAFLKELLELTTFRGLHIITAIGDSMFPTIESGDKLFVLPFETESLKVREGGIYIINCHFGVLVKRIYFNPFTKEMILKSDNKEIPDITISGDELDGCQIIGRVVGSLKRF